MEAKSYFKILFLSFNFLFIYSCTKTQGPPQLPPATHTGANVVACKVNGKVFIATGNFGNTGLGVSYIITYDSIAFIDVLGDSLYNTLGGNNFRLHITSKYIGIGTDSIINIPYSPGGGIYDDYYYTTIPPGGGTVTYTYYDGNILAGTFAFDAADAAGTVVHITEGRFDIAKH